MENFYNVITYLSSAHLDESFSGQPIAVGEFDNIALQYYVSDSATLSGSLQIQKSLDGEQWVNLGSAISLSGDTVGIVHELNVQFGYVRMVYSFSSGSGLLTVKIATINN